jgi:hypothetical protein
MLVLQRFTLARRACLGLFMAVMALILVPPLVRATSTGFGSSPIRLNRGYEAPPAKCSIEPPGEAAPHAEPPDAAAVPHAFALVSSADQSLPSSLLAFAPDDQRGPPDSLYL